jgi:TonB family protein
MPRTFVRSWKYLGGAPGNARVHDPTPKCTTDPAFGEAALEAVRFWRFLPKVKDGRPVEALVELPFSFTPPDEPHASGKS